GVTACVPHRRDETQIVPVHRRPGITPARFPATMQPWAAVFLQECSREPPYFPLTTPSVAAQSRRTRANSHEVRHSQLVLARRSRPGRGIRGGEGEGAVGGRSRLC